MSCKKLQLFSLLSLLLTTTHYSSILCNDEDQNNIYDSGYQRCYYDSGYLPEGSRSMFDSGYQGEEIALEETGNQLPETQEFNTNVMQPEINPKDFSIIPLAQCLQNGSGTIQYLSCQAEQPFNFEPFPLSIAPQHQPHQSSFNETFILSISQGRVCSPAGWVLVNNCLIKELIWKNNILGLKNLKKTSFKNIRKVSGRVAVLAQRGDYCYFHHVAEILGRLALLEMNNIEYDWLYVSTRKPFMKESLELWGVDMNKVIEPSEDENHFIEADQLIVPSLVSKIGAGYTKFASYVTNYTLQYVQNKLLSQAALKGSTGNKWCPRVFISRQDSSIRQTINEDAVFALFETIGFERYSLSKLSFLEQIELFNNAEIVVGTHGAGLTNTLFCKPETQIVELFQARGSATYWYISQILGLRHMCVKTADFDLQKNGFIDLEIPLSVIETIITQL